MRVDQVLVAQQVRHHRRHRHEVPAGHGDEGLDGLHARGDRLDQRQEREVEEEDGVLRVIGDPHDLVRMQPGVERVQHGAGTRHRVVQLHVAVAVPGERRDTIAEADAVRGQRVGHAARALGEVAVGLAMQVAFDAARDDFLVAVVTLRMGEERRDQQRLLHHVCVHGGSSYQRVDTNRPVTAASMRSGTAPKCQPCPKPPPSLTYLKLFVAMLRSWLQVRTGFMPMHVE